MKTPSFWQWFTANEKKLRSLHNLSMCERAELLFWLSQHLKYYSPRIGHRLTIPKNGNEPPTLSFSICGDPEVRGLILDLMAEAPSYQDWIISASLNSLAEDPDYFEKEYCLEGICCRPSNIRFWAEVADVNTKKFILAIIFTFSISYLEATILKQLVEIILTDTLGESLYHRHIKDFKIHSQVPEKEELFPLYELKIYLEDL